MAKVTHSLLKSPVERFIRDSVVYDEFAYRIDREKSSLQAYVEDDNLWWMLEIECVDAEYPTGDDEHRPPSCAPCLGLTFPNSVRPSDWRALEDTSYKFTFDDDQAFPLNPWIPSNAYIGHHHSCTEHHISFGRLDGTVYQIRWKPLAKAYADDFGFHFYVDADVPFTGIKVGTVNSPDLESIEATLKQWFDLDEFESAKDNHSDLWFAIKSDRFRQEDLDAKS